MRFYLRLSNTIFFIAYNSPFQAKNAPLAPQIAFTKYELFRGNSDFTLDIIGLRV